MPEKVDMLGKRRKPGGDELAGGWVTDCKWLTLDISKVNNSGVKHKVADEEDAKCSSIWGIAQSCDRLHGGEG